MPITDPYYFMPGPRQNMNAPVQYPVQHAPMIRQRQEDYSMPSPPSSLFDFSSSPALFGGDIAGGVGANGGWQGAFGGDIAASSSGGPAVAEGAGGGIGGAWSSAGSAGPVGAMILGSLAAQYAGQNALGNRWSDTFFPTLTGQFDDGKVNTKGLLAHGLGMGWLAPWISPRGGGTDNEGTLVFGK